MTNTFNIFFLLNRKKKQLNYVYFHPVFIFNSNHIINPNSFFFSSIYAGLSVFINFIFMITWILSGIIISSEWPYIPIIHWSFSRNADVIYENILNVKSSFDNFIIVCVEKYNLALIVILGFIGTVSMFSVLLWPRLQVPDSSEFQLFERKHLMEQYDLVYKDRFRFSHAYSVSNIRRDSSTGRQIITCVF